MGYQKLWDVLIDRIVEWIDMEDNPDAIEAFKDVLDEMMLLEELNYEE